jgi:hypothetical protein
MIGYHVFYQKTEEINFVEISSQFASILFWKKHFGPMRLYCNSKFLKTISFYKLDTLYDEINIDVLDNIPYNKKTLEKYWSVAKIYAANDISKKETTYCILDTDLWITNKINWDISNDFVGFHFETFNLDDKNNPYLEPSYFINDYVPNEWDVLPINCAFMYINNKQLIFDWFEYMNNVILLNKKSLINKKRKKDAHTLFIEQRVITYLCKKLNLKYTSLINNKYHSGSGLTLNNISVWEPELDFTLEPHKFIKHIWGLKRFYSVLNKKILTEIYDDIHNEFGFLEMEFEQLYKERLKIYYIEY